MQSKSSTAMLPLCLTTMCLEAQYSVPNMSKYANRRDEGKLAVECIGMYVQELGSGWVASSLIGCMW